MRPNWLRAQGIIVKYPDSSGLKNMRLRIQWFRVDGRRIREKKKGLLNSRTKTTTRVKFDLKFFRVFSENRYPGKLHRTLESPENLTLLSSLKQVKPSPDHNLIKLVTFYNSFPPLRLLILELEWRRLSRFPAKMTLAHGRAILKIKKISFSY